MLLTKGISLDGPSTNDWTLALLILMKMPQPTLLY